MGILFGAAHGMVWMTNGSLAVNQVPAHSRGTANATFYLVFDGSISIAATVWGMCIDALGYVGTYRLAACGYALMILIAIFFYRKKSAPQH